MREKHDVRSGFGEYPVTIRKQNAISKRTEVTLMKKFNLILTASLIAALAVSTAAFAKPEMKKAEPHRVERERLDQRLGAADGAGLVQARGDEGDGHRDSSASMRALRSATSFLWRRSMISMAARRTLFVWFCCDQRR